MKRKDGTRVKNIMPMYAVVPYIMDHRYDAMNMIELDFPVEPIQKYLNEKRKEGYSFSHMGIVIAAYVRCIAEFPLLNRFIMNKKVYARNEIAAGMVVLKPGDEESMSKMRFKPEDTVFDVSRIINEYVALNREVGDQNNTDNMIKFLLSVPGLCSLVVGLAKWLDRHNMLPKFIIDLSPFHMSFGITNLASVRTNHVLHHCYEFGTTSVFLSMGNLREVPMRKGGETVITRCIPVGVVMDERICPGAYFAKVCQRLTQYLANPALLEEPPAEVHYDE